MTKEDKIKEAYGENYNLVKDFIDKYGWCTRIDYRSGEEKINHKILNELGFYKDDGKLETYMSDKGHFWRPIELKGFEHNNGWTKIESKADLPKDSFGLYHVISKEDFFCELPKNQGIEEYWQNDRNKVNDWLENFTHWQPISKPDQPVY